MNNLLLLFIRRLRGTKEGTTVLIQSPQEIDDEEGKVDLDVDTTTGHMLIDDAAGLP